MYHFWKPVDLSKFFKNFDSLWNLGTLPGNIDFSKVFLYFLLIHCRVVSDKAMPVATETL